MKRVILSLLWFSLKMCTRIRRLLEELYEYPEFPETEADEGGER
jgi:hypothetical protein